MVLDECLAYRRRRSGGRARRCERTLRWARRAPRSHARVCDEAGRTVSTVTNPGQAQFGIVQGGVYPDAA